MKTQNVGTFNGGVHNSKSFGFKSGSFTKRITDASIANGAAFLVSELEKRDPDIRRPLTSVTYTRDIPIKTGGGWVEEISNLNIDYGTTGGSGSGMVHAGGANGVPVIQAQLGKDIYKTHIFSQIMRIMFVDMQKENITGRSLDDLLKRGIRLSYDKHLNQNCYMGMPEFGTTGLLNNPNVNASNVSQGASSQTAWSSKTPDEILFDINTAIAEVWEAGGYDLEALPNHIIMPYEQYNYIATTKVSTLAEKTILTYVLENNIATKNGKDLFIGGTAYCKGAGAAGSDRMAVYVHDEYFIAMEELVPLSRTMTQPNTNALAYDSVYMANVSEVEMFYNQSIRYYDGI